MFYCGSYNDGTDGLGPTLQFFNVETINKFARHNLKFDSRN